MSAVIHLSDPDTGLSYCGEPLTIIGAKDDTRPICRTCHRGSARRLRRMVGEYRNEAVDLRAGTPNRDRLRVEIGYHVRTAIALHDALRDDPEQRRASIDIQIGQATAAVLNLLARSGP